MVGIQRLTADEIRAELSVLSKRRRELRLEGTGEAVVRDVAGAPGLTRGFEPLWGQVRRNPLPWVLGAVVTGVIASRLFSSSEHPKKAREKASQIGEFPITHGSLPSAIMKTGFDLAKPVLLRASKEWIARSVDTKR